MKLHELFGRIGPMFRGRATPADTARALYGDADGDDRRRFVLYDNIAPIRGMELAATFTRCAAVVGAGWPALAHAYFVAHPWGRFDGVADGARFPAFVAAEAAARALPGWLADLATVELAMALAGRRPIEPQPGVGPVRLAPSVTVHRLDHDVARWVMAKPRPPAPIARATWIATYQTPAGAGWCLPLDDVEHAVVAMLAAGELAPEQVPASFGVTGAALRRLGRKGLVHGDLAQLPAELDDPDAEHAVALGRDLSRGVVLAPFVQIRFEDGELCLWSPVAEHAVTTDDPAVIEIARVIATPCTVGELIAEVADRMPPAEVVTILDGLAHTGLVMSSEGVHSAVGAGWDASEAAAHVSAAVRADHDGPLPPAIAPASTADVVELPAVAATESIGDLAAALARRTSTRAFAARPIPLATLARVLALSARNRGAAIADRVTRPYPSAGGRHPLELYPVVRAGGVDGLVAGIYRYRPDAHRLERISAEIEPAAACLARTGLPDPGPAVVIAIAARIERAVRGPDGSTLAQIHTETGCLIQNLYLVAAALELGACAVAVAGDDLGLDPWLEPALAGVALGYFAQ